MRTKTLILIGLCILLSGCAGKDNGKIINYITPSPEIAVTATPVTTFPEVSSVTQEPIPATPEASVFTPISETPEIQTAPPSSEPQNQIIITEDELISLLYMSKSEVFSILGEGYKEYTLVPNYYYYEDIEIGFEFMDDGSVLHISIINNNITISGVRRSMSLEEIAAILGEGYRIKDDTQGTYGVFYYFDEYVLHVYALGTDEESQKDKAFSLLPVTRD
jgi:hypothetical protein